MRKIAFLLLALSLTISAVACEDTAKKEEEAANRPTATIVPTIAAPTCEPAAVPTGEATGTDVPTVDAEPTVQPDCLVIYDVVVGDGQEATATDTVSVNYTGWLADGTVFDATSKHTPPDPSQFPLSGVIVGWQEGIPGMKVGGQRRLVIPAALAYRETGQGSIPPNAVLTFDVELVSIP